MSDNTPYELNLPNYKDFQNGTVTTYNLPSQIIFDKVMGPFYLFLTPYTIGSNDLTFPLFGWVDNWKLNRLQVYFKAENTSDYKLVRDFFFGKRDTRRNPTKNGGKLFQRGDQMWTAPSCNQISPYV